MNSLSLTTSHLSQRRLAIHSQFCNSNFLAMKEVNSSSSSWVFFLLWIGQFVSLLGTDITKFGLRVWSFQQTKSVTQFALVTFFTEMPALILSPFAGAVVDRVSRKKVMIISDMISAGSTLVLYALQQSSENTTVSHICRQSVTNLAHLCQ